ncbi:MAG: helix-turn-helix domain-containing protein [Clostridia bacterium]|nr:helix-turn-helix domain-containing protein [Clostridia bacterium]
MFNHIRMKNARQYRQLTQKQLGDLIGVSSSAIGMYEQHRRLPDADTISRLSDALKISTDWLCGDIGSDDMVMGELIDRIYRKLLAEHDGISFSGMPMSEGEKLMVVDALLNGMSLISVFKGEPLLA